ncbi:MAG: hypothetical protein KAJ49_05205 [Arcobacteraceae bacterium]|nr:hypothetical protein [Arcobacteraceae bacterium]
MINKNIRNKLLKTITLSLLFTNNIFATDYIWHCAGDVSSSSIYNWSTDNANPYAVYGFENIPDYHPEIMGEMDTVNYTFFYWDDTSPVCGGSSTENRLIESYCNDTNQNSCWDVLLGEGDTPLIEVSEAGYTNSVIFVNKYPCLPRDTKNFTFGAYEWDNNTDLGLANANINTIFEESIEIVSEDIAKEQRAVCTPPDPNAPIDYTAQLNEIITNTAPNSSTVDRLTNIDNRQQTQNDNLNNFISSKSVDTMMNIDTDLQTFNTTFETTLSNTYSTYSDIFGFGGYGVAPDPISFTMFTKEYKVFDPTVLTPYINTIRDTFVIFAYLWGFIIVFKNT